MLTAHQNVRQRRGLSGQPQPQKPQDAQPSPIAGLMGQTFEKPKMNWSEALGLLSGKLMDYDGSWGGGHADAAQARFDGRVSEQRGEFEADRQNRLMMAAASGDPFALAMIDPIGDRNFKYNEGRDAIADTRWQKGWDREDQRYGDTRSDRAEDVAWRDGRAATEDRQWQDTFDEGRRQFGLNYGLKRDELDADISGSGSGDLGLTPVFARDANGNRVLIQTSKSGDPRMAALPEGITLEDDRYKEYGRTQGRELAKSEMYQTMAGQTVLAAERKAQEMAAQIDLAIEQTNGWNTGMLGRFVFAGNLDATLDALGAKAMLSELVAVKAQGGTLGALSDAEGKALRDAAVAVSRSQSEKQLDRNLAAYKTQLEKTSMVLRQAYESEYAAGRFSGLPRSGQSVLPSTAPGNLETASDDDLFNILGGR